MITIKSGDDKLIRTKITFNLDDSDPNYYLYTDLYVKIRMAVWREIREKLIFPIRF